MLTQVAYHEAAHAVLDLLFDFPFTRVCVHEFGGEEVDDEKRTTDAGIAADVEYAQFVALSQGDTSQLACARIRAEEWLMTILGGEAAAWNLTGERPHLDSTDYSDYHRALALARLLFMECTEETHEAFLWWLTLRAKDLIADHWEPVERIASLVIEKGEVTFDECCAIFTPQ